MLAISNDLRQAVLQAAIQGKLTEQLPEDGNAKDLLQAIRAEKQRLIAEKKIKREKTSKPIAEDEIPFDIPENWCFARFGELVWNFDSQRRPVTAKNRVCGIYPYYGATGEIDKVEAFLFDGKYLLIGEDGGNFFVNRPNSFIVEGRFWANNHVHVVQPQKIQIEFLKYFLDSLNLPAMGLIKGIAVPKLNQGALNSIVVAIPPIGEQQRIVARVDELMSEIDELEKIEKEILALKKAFLNDMKASLLQAAMQGKLTQQLPEDGDAADLLRSIQAEKQKLIAEKKIKKEKPLSPISEDEIPFDIPENWKWVRLGECITLISGQDLTPSQYNSSGVGTVYLTGASNIENGKIVINRWTEHARAIAEKGDLLLTCKGTVGTTCLLQEEKVHIARQIMALRPVAVDVRYIHFFIMSYVDSLKSQAKSLIPGIERANVLSAMFPLPPLTEQKRIVEKLAQLLPLCDGLADDQ